MSACNGNPTRDSACSTARSSRSPVSCSCSSCF
jgi:hypothetical protein